MKGKNKLLDFYLQYKLCEISLGSVKMLLKFALAERIRACQNFFVAYFIIVVSSTVGLHTGAPQSPSICIRVTECRQIVEEISGKESKPLYARRQHY